MNEARAKEIAEAIIANQEQLKEAHANTMEEVRQILRDNGNDFSKEELEAFEELSKTAPLPEELSEESLENVAGGFSLIIASLIWTAAGLLGGVAGTLYDRHRRK